MNGLLNSSLLSDPEYSIFKTQFIELVAKHSRKITQIKPPEAAFRQGYLDTIRLFGQYRGMDLFYPYLGSGLGNGALVQLADGSVKYDFISGIGVHFGHCHPKIIEAALDAASKDIVMQGHLMQNLESFALTELLIQQSGLDHGILTTSGTMANENALKIIFQKRSPRRRILSFERCFMGRSLAFAQITDKPAFREGLPINMHVDYLPFYDWKDPKGSTERAVSVLKECLKRYPDQYACMCFELIQGEAGNYPGKPEFFLSLLKILKDHNIAILVDEVQTFGRTDRLFAFQHFGIQDYVDVVTVGKLAHTCATLFRHNFCPKPGLISQTFTGSTASILAGKVIIESLLNDGFLGKEGKNMQIRRCFIERFQRLENLYPDRFEGPFGHGLMIAFTPFKGDREKALAFIKSLFESGVIGFLAGSDPARVRFLVPAGSITESEIDKVCQIVEETIKRM